MKEQYKLLKGDMLIEIKSIEDSSVDLIITDPPYGVNYKGGTFDDSEYAVDVNVPKWFNEWYRVLKNDKYLFIFAGVKTLHRWIQYGISAGFTYKNILATRSFNNGSIAPKNNFGFQFQPILVFSKGDGASFNDVDFIPTSDLWLKDKRNKNPKQYTYEYPNFIKTEWAYATAKVASSKYHPNEKNVELTEFLVKLVTSENEVVLDTFMGSGTTGIAALNCNRYFIGIELEETYFDTAEKRIKNKCWQMNLIVLYYM